MTATDDGIYTTTVGSQTVQLPLVPLTDDVTIALLICVDLGVSFAETAGRELAELMRPARPEIVVSVATMGIPLAIEASRALGHEGPDHDGLGVHAPDQAERGRQRGSGGDDVVHHGDALAAHRVDPGGVHAEPLGRVGRDGVHRLGPALA